MNIDFDKEDLNAMLDGLSCAEINRTLNISGDELLDLRTKLIYLRETATGGGK